MTPSRRSGGSEPGLATRSSTSPPRSWALCCRRWKACCETSARASPTRVCPRLVRVLSTSSSSSSPKTPHRPGTAHLKPGGPPPASCRACGHRPLSPDRRSLWRGTRTAGGLRPREALDRSHRGRRGWRFRRPRVRRRRSRPLRLRSRRCPTLQGDGPAAASISSQASTSNPPLRRGGRPRGHRTAH